MAAAAAGADAKSGGISMRPVKLCRSPLAFLWTCMGSFKPGLDTDQTQDMDAMVLATQCLGRNEYP